MRDKHLWNAVPFDHPADGLLLNQDVINIQVHRGTEGRGSNYCGHPHKCQGFDGLPQNSGHPGGLYGVFHSCIQQLPDRFHRIFIFPIDRMGCTQFLGKLETLIMNINGDDRRASHRPGRHQRTQADRTTTETGDTGSRPGVQGIQYSTGPGLNPATQGAENVQIHLPVHFHHILLTGQCVSCKGRLAKESGEILSVPMDATGRVRTVHDEIQFCKILTNVWVTCETILASSTIGKR